MPDLKGKTIRLVSLRVTDIGLEPVAAFCGQHTHGGWLPVSLKESLYSVIVGEQIRLEASGHKPVFVVCLPPAKLNATSGTEW